MLTPERIQQIDEMVERWSDENQEEYPCDEFRLNSDTYKTDPELFARAAKDIGINPEELKEYFRQSGEELLRKHKEEYDELRAIHKKHRPPQ